MRSKILLVVELTVALSVTILVVATLKARERQDGKPFNKDIPVAVEQLPHEKGVFPVEVRCGSAHLTAPNTLEQVSCMAINNTNRNIVALAAVLRVITEKGGGGESINTYLLQVDSLVHPDVRKARNLKSVQPTTAATLQSPGPLAYEDEVVNRVELKMDYVEFEDTTSLGPDTNGSRVIHSIREGASRYKSWLVKKYRLDRGNVGVVVQALDDPDIPAELQLDGDGNMSAGARLYRKAMRGVYEGRGAVELKKYLER